LFALLQQGRITLEEAIHNATNADEFKLLVSGITSSGQAMNVEGNMKKDAPPSREKLESVIVKL
jgi:Tfp pilus assembly ATPase PilU